MAPSLRSRKGAGIALLGLSAAALTVGIVTTATGSSGGTSGAQAAGSSSSAEQPNEPTNGNSATGSTGGSSAASSSGAAGSSAGSSTTSSTPSSVSTSYPPGQTTTEVPAPGTNTPNQPAGGSTSAPRGGGGAGQHLAPLRVYNNSTIKGLAAKAAQDFRNAGYTVVSVGNYSQGVIPSTTAYYRPGTDEQATAEKLAKRFGFDAQPRFAGIQHASAGVIVIITNNFHG